MRSRNFCHPSVLFYIYLSNTTHHSNKVALVRVSQLTCLRMPAASGKGNLTRLPEFSHEKVAQNKPQKMNKVKSREIIGYIYSRLEEATEGR